MKIINGILEEELKKALRDQEAHEKAMLRSPRGPGEGVCQRTPALLVPMTYSCCRNLFLMV